MKKQIIIFLLTNIFAFFSISQVFMGLNISNPAIVSSGLWNNDESIRHSSKIDLSKGDTYLVRQKQQLGSNNYFLPIIRNHTAYYVSKQGSSNGDGKSWATAWNELDQINWNIIQPGDTIMIDGGVNSMIYTSDLDVEASGSPNKPITIRLASEPGRDGKVIMFGGRSTMLPYCGQQNYDFQTTNVSYYAMELRDVSWLVIDGTKWGGITIYGYNRNAMRYYNSTSNITIRNVEAYDNGFAESSGGEWEPNGAGILVAGQHHIFERVIVHDNGADALQSASGQDNDLGDLTIRESWLYNGRIHPTVDESYNYCAHTDGLQIYNGGDIDGVTIEESIVGPGFTNGIILGQLQTSSGSWAVVDNVTLRNVLFMKAADNNILVKRDTQPTNWNVDRVTAHCPNTKGHCIVADGFDHSVTNSIFQGARLTFPDGLDHFSGNCQWNTSGFVLGQIVAPAFTNVGNDPFSLDNYALLPNSPCLGKGSSITSVDQLLSQE